MRTILITGASRGLGKSIKENFSKREFNVVAPSREELDLSKPESVKTFIKSLKLEKIDILINNAAVNNISPLINIELDSIIETFNINTFSPLLLTKEVIRKYFLPNGGGQIINICTFWLKRTKEYRTTYGMSKAALNYLTKSIAIEFGSKNIRCNSISPGFIDTDLTRKNNSENELKDIEEKIPIKRLAKPNEISDLINFLIDNEYINGENIYIDGGISKSF